MSQAKFLKTSEYDQEMPQSHTAHQPMASRGRATEHWLSQDTRKSNHLSLPHQDDCKLDGHKVLNNKTRTTQNPHTQ